jgi:hypothetical protein
VEAVVDMLDDGFVSPRSELASGRAALLQDEASQLPAIFCATWALVAAGAARRVTRPPCAHRGRTPYRLTQTGPIDERPAAAMRAEFKGWHRRC